MDLNSADEHATQKGFCFEKAFVKFTCENKIMFSLDLLTNIKFNSNGKYNNDLDDDK